jgi:hypothetical protein
MEPALCQQTGPGILWVCPRFPSVSRAADYNVTMLSAGADDVELTPVNKKG